MKKTLSILLVSWLLLTLTARGQDLHRIKKALDHANLKNADVSLEVLSITHNRVVYSKGERTPLILASNNKLISTASAIHHLGPDYELKTGLYAKGPINGVKLQGDLILRGHGDPCFSGIFNENEPLASLEALVQFALKAGIGEVDGALVIDDSIFDREFTPPGWPQDQLNRSYCAPVSGVSLMENVVLLCVKPGSRVNQNAGLSFFPMGAPFRIKGFIKTTAKGSKNLINIGRPNQDGSVRVNGQTPLGARSSNLKAAVRNPPEYFGAVFHRMFLNAGVKINRGWSLVESRVDYQAEDLKKLGEVKNSLKDIVIVVNKTSHNHCADQIFKLAGWKVAGKGGFLSGEFAAQKLFQAMGVKDTDPFKMADGSGLSRDNRFSAHTITQLLYAIYQCPWRDMYIRSLPISGTDGSLKKRLTREPFKSRVRAKTGWIRAASALSGYAQSTNGTVYAFSILINNYRGGNSTMKSIQDEICKAIVEG